MPSEVVSKGGMSVERLTKKDCKTLWPVVKPDCTVYSMTNRLAAIEDIPGDDYDLDRLRDLAQVDREGRCTIVSDFVYRFGETKGIIKIPYKPWMERYIGSKFFRTEKEAAGEALRRKQNE